MNGFCPSTGFSMLSHETCSLMSFPPGIVFELFCGKVYSTCNPKWTAKLSNLWGVYFAPLCDILVQKLEVNLCNVISELSSHCGVHEFICFSTLSTPSPTIRFKKVSSDYFNWDESLIPNIYRLTTQRILVF